MILRTSVVILMICKNSVIYDHALFARKAEPIVLMGSCASRVERLYCE